MSEKIQKLIALVLGILAMSIAVGYLVFAWTGPSANPPQNNVPAPINVGNTTQTKSGGLNILGNVGIGTTSPAVSGLHIGSGVSGGQARIQLDNSNGRWAQLNRWTNRLEILASDAIQFAIGSIGNTKLTIDSSGVKPSNVVAVYTVNPFCDLGGTLTLSLTCSTRLCGAAGWIPLYYNCFGGCNQLLPNTCANLFSGYLIQY